MTGQASFQIQARLCKSLGHPVRLEMLHYLRSGPKQVTELARLVGQPESTVSRHLSLLRSAGVVLANHQGRTVHYRIANSKLFQVCDLMRQTLDEQHAREARIARYL
ncbi:MAG: ArsR/SmtB family transcription factor [Anaerolineales bacterium]|jgi:DNA-binding transcriptional ArsR family regulator